METELARVVDIVMTWAKRIYILIIEVNKLFSFFSSRCFLKEIENMCSWKFGRTPKRCGAAHAPTAFLVLPNFHSYLYNSFTLVLDIGYCWVKSKANFLKIVTFQKNGALCDLADFCYGCHLYYRLWVLPSRRNVGVAWQHICICHVQPEGCLGLFSLFVV